MRRNRGDIVASLFLIFIGIGVIVQAFRLRIGTPTQPQPGSFPLVAGVAMVALSVILLLRALRGSSAGGQAFGNPKHPAIIVAVMLVYTLFFERLGYIIVTLMVSAVALRLLGTRWWIVAAFSLFLSVGTYVLFDKILIVLLPDGVLAGLF